MDLQLTQDQSLLADTFARLLAEHSTPAHVRAAEPLGYDAKLWQRLVELGSPGARVSEERGGLGLGLRDLTLIAFQCGYRLASVPLIECVVAAKLLADIADWPVNSLLERVNAGEGIVSLALRPIQHNTPQLIPAGAVAHAVLGLDGDRLLLIPKSVRATTALPNLGSQPLAFWDLDTADATVVAEGAAARALYEAALEEWKLLTAAALTGISARAMEYAAEYSNEREAFGVKIGSFQGLSHPLADCAIANDGAKLLIEYAIWKLEQRHTDAAGHISMAYFWAGETCANTMPQCVHMFGGYGVSIEHDIQLFARRGMALASVFGDRQHELLNVAERLWNGQVPATPEPRVNGLDFALGDRAEAMLARVRGFFARHLTSEHEAYRGHSWDSYHPEIYKKLAQENLLFPHWPEAWGGLDATPAEQLAITQVFYESRWTDYPQGVSGMVAEMINLFGSDELKREVLPEIKQGDAICALGFTEPHCGSDVFAVKTLAAKKGDRWVINGQKMFTSGANIAKYVLLLTSTSPAKAKHIGKTMFLVPLSSPGVDVQRVDTISGDRTHITYYTDVEIPDSHRIGAIDAGATVMGHMLTLEQGGFPSGFEFKKMVGQAVAWALKTKRNGQRVFDDPLVRLRLAAAMTDLTIAELMLLRITEQKEKGKKSRHHGSMLKAFVCEAWKRHGAALIDMASPYSLLQGTPDLAYIESGWRASLASAIYGGTTQVHRSVVAEKALGMPRSRLA